MGKIFWIDRDDPKNGEEWKEYIDENQLILAIKDVSDNNLCLRKLEKNKASKISQWIPDFDLENEEYYYFEVLDIKNEDERNIIKDFIEKYKDSELNKILELIDAFTRRVTQNLELSTLEGDIGEALFFEKCVELELLDEIYNFYDEKSLDEERIDFIIKDKKFEIKTTTRQKLEINITDKQISESPNVVVVMAEFNENGTTILDIYDRIKQKMNRELPKFLMIKERDYINKSPFLKNLTINENYKINFKFFDNSKLPKIDSFEYSDILKKITYTLAASFEETELSFEEQLKNIINS